MENLTSYVLGVAAKSNIEKRKVGCVITLDGVIIAEGYNTVDTHAEEHAVLALEESGKQQSTGVLTAHVSHPPCPECARALTNAGVTEVRVVNAFMKFDGDKTRFDLVDPDFALFAWKYKFDLFCPITEKARSQPTTEEIKKNLYLWAQSAHVDFAKGALDPWKVLCASLFDQYDNFYVMEEALAKVLTFGARKYKPNNWKECTDTGRYLAAAHRHLNAAITGEDNDPETGLPHLDHMLCNLMFLHVLGLK